MNHLSMSSRAWALVASVVAASAISLAAQTTQHETLASVKLPRAVLANGQPLGPGTYALRLTGEFAAPVAGQTLEASPWVEFVQGDQVKGRELATVVQEADALSVLKGPGPPSGSARIDILEGNEYLRIWVNRSGVNYLIHLPLK